MDEIGQLQKDCQLIQIYFSLEDIVKEHGQESRKTKEALALLNKVIVDLTKFVAKYDKMDRNLLLLIFEDNSHDFRRIRRQDSGEEEGGEKVRARELSLFSFIILFKCLCCYCYIALGFGSSKFS